MNGICLTCRGKGLPGGCPECGKVLSYGAKGSVTVTSEMLEKNTIPTDYLSIGWSIDELKASHSSLCNSESFERYCQQLTKIHDIFEKGMIPNQSAIVIAGRAMGKHTFAYTCLKQALQHGYTICPLVDNTTVRRINCLSAEKQDSKYLWGLPSIEKLIYSDVVFLSIDVDNYGNALRTIESLMIKRANVDKVTFVITRFSLEAMSQFEKKGSYISFIETTRRYNNKKYPAIISCL